MATDTISLKNKRLGDDVRLEIRIRHPMETGTRSDAQGRLIPARFIQQLEVQVQRDDQFELLLRTHCGTGVSRNPYFAMELLAIEKDTVVEVSWLDSSGDTDSRLTKIK